MQFEKLLRQSLIWRGFYFAAILLLNIVLSRFLQADGSGWVYFLTNIFAFILLAGSFNIESGIGFYAANGEIKEQPLASFALLSSLISSVIILPLTCLYFYLFPQQEVGILQGILYGLLYSLGILMCNFFSVLFYAKKNYLLPNLWLGSINIILVLVVIILRWFGYPVITIINTYFGFFLIQGLGLMVLYFVKQNLSFTLSVLSKNQLGLLLKFSLVSLTGNIIFFFVYKIDYWFVNRWCSAADLGNYIQAAKLGQILLIVPQILAGTIFPQTAEGLNKAVIKQNIIIISRLLIQFFILLILLCLLVGKPFFIAVFGPSFNTMHMPFLLLLPGILSLSMLALLSAYFGGMNKVKVNITGAAIALAVVIAANLIFTKKYGITVASVISSIGYTVNLAYALYIFYKDETVTMKEFFMWRLSDYLWLKKILTNKHN